MGCMGFQSYNAEQYCEGLRLLVSEHPPLRAQMQELTDLAHAVTAETLPALYEREKVFKKQLEAHSAKEEDGLFILLGRYIGTQTGPIAVMEYEHQAAKQLLSEFEAEVESRGADASEQDVQRIGQILTRACAILFDHFAKEEQVLFPLAEMKLNAVEKEELLGFAKQPLE